MASQLREIKEISFGKSIKVIVDGFAFPNPFVRHYFLTHTHSDHTIGLKKTFNQGLIYCSEAAANLLRHDFGLLNTSVIRALPLGETVAVTGGLRVTTVSANHSPDAVMFVFDYVDDGGVEKRVVHTGDMRWTSCMASRVLLEKPIDRLYLDTTYLNRKYTFPTQERVVVGIADWMRQQLLAEPKTYFTFMTYHVGKERACFGAAECLNMKVYVTPKKRKTLDLLNLPERWKRLMVNDPREACIRVGGRINEDEVQEDVKKLGFAKGVIIRPTGWSYRKGALVTTRVSAHGIIIVGAPYSEHSSYEEIRECVKTLKPRRVIPTVGGAGDALVEKELIGFMDLRGDKRRIESYFSSRSPVETITAPRPQGQVVDLTESPLYGKATHIASSGNMPNSKHQSPHKIIPVGALSGAEAQPFDLEQVDVAEQHRILQDLERSRLGKKRGGTGVDRGPSAPKKLSIVEKFFRKRE